MKQNPTNEDFEEVVLANGVVTFDGRVLECFGLGLGGSSHRMHAAQITHIELTEKRFLGPALEVHNRGVSDYTGGIEGDASQIAALERLIAKVDASRGT